MKLFFSLVLLLLLPSVCISQSVLDSMRQLVHEAPTDQKRVDYLNDLGNYLFDYSLEESSQVTDEAIRLSTKINYDYGLGWALIHKGIYHWLAGNSKEALEVQQEAEQIGRRIPDAGILAYVKLQNGKVYREIGLYDSAIINFRRAEVLQKSYSRENPYAMSMILIAIGKQYNLNESPEQGIPYLEQALQIREKMKNNVLISYTWIDIGHSYRLMYDLKKARECYEKAYRLNSDDIWLQAEYAEGIGHIAFAEGEFEVALKNLNVVLKTYEVYKGKHTLAETMIAIAEILEEKGLFDLANEYLFRVLKISEESDYRLLAAEAHYELAWVSLRTNRLNEARASISQSKKIFESLGNSLRVGGCYNVSGLIQMKAQKYDSALISHLKGLEIRRQFQNKVAISSSLFNIGDLYLTWGKNDEALRFLKEGIQIDEQLGDKYGISLYENRLGKVYTNLGDYTKAEVHFLRAMELSQKTTATDLLRSICNDYSILFEKRGNLKEALAYRKLYEQINDSLYNRGSAESLAAYRSLYELDVKNREIEFLNKDKQLQQEKIQQRNQVLIIVLIASIMLTVLVIVLYRSGRRMKRLNRDISERNEEIQTQSEELQESNQALSNLNKEISDQREEIHHQAEELRVSHETIGKINEGLEKMVSQRTNELRSAYQELDTFFYRSSHDFRRPLTTLMGLAEVAKLSVKDVNALDLFEKVSMTAVNLDKMLVKLQSISDVGSHQLVFKEVLLKQIIENAFEPYRDVLREKQARIVVDVKLDKAFISYPVLIKIIIENLIENAVNFSSPGHPQVLTRAYRNGSTVFLEVEDNGEGISEEIKAHIFDMFFRGSERSSGNGLGLYIAKKALEKISGKISFTSNREYAGTTFRVEIPDQG